MSRHVVTSAVLLLVVVMMCCGGEASSARSGVSTGPTHPFTGMTMIPSLWQNLSDRDAVASFRHSSLADFKGGVFAIAEVEYREEYAHGTRTAIASKQLEVSGIDSTVISTNDTGFLDVQYFLDASEANVSAKDVRRPTTIVSGDNVYMLVGSHRTKTSAPKGRGRGNATRGRRRTRTPQSKDSNENERALFLVVGHLTEDGGRQNIKWTDTYAVKPVPSDYSLRVTEVLAVGGSGVVMDGAPVFPVQVTDEKGRSLLMSMHFIQPGNKWELSLTAVGEGCRAPSIVEWGGERLVMIASCAGGCYEVYMSMLGGQYWYGGGEAIGCVWGNSRGREGYGVRSGSATATIDGKNVLLLTTPVYSGDGEGEGKGRLHLWLTDDTRVYDVGPVSREGDDAAASSLLYKNGTEELILLYEKKEGGEESYGLVSVRLTEKLEQIKSVVRTWTAVDNAIEESTPPAEVPKTASRFVDILPSYGLVGFLSGNVTDTEWSDEYLCVNATLYGTVTGTENGVMLKGAKAGAVWPVGKQGQNQLYHFANYVFTFVATVTIHEAPKEGSPIPLMGVRVNDTANSVLFGLSYTPGGMWSPVFGNTTEHPLPDEGWAPGTTYQVALVLDSGSACVVVDGKVLTNGTCVEVDLLKPHGISHFYIGGESEDQGAESSHVEVTDVLLYSRALYFSELRRLRGRNSATPQPGAGRPVAEPKTFPVMSEVAPTPPEPVPEPVNESRTLPVTSEVAPTPPEPVPEPATDSGMEYVAGDHTDEVHERHAPEHETPAPKSHRAESGSGVRPDGRLALLGDAKLILQDLTVDSTVRVCVSRVLVLLLLGLCGLVAVF